MDCVAVCFVDGDIWVASNSRKLEPEDIDEAIGADYCGWNVYNCNKWKWLHACRNATC